jgi:hypothetical protein
MLGMGSYISDYDYVRREVMIPMRDGVKLFTVIVVPKLARNAPILHTRTPYDATKRTARNNSTHMLAALPEADEMFVADGYIRVFQDVRGKYKSEGDYVVTRPVRGPLNQTQVDHVTDAYDKGQADHNYLVMGPWASMLRCGKSWLLLAKPSVRNATTPTRRRWPPKPCAGPGTTWKFSSSDWTSWDSAFSRRRPTTRTSARRAAGCKRSTSRSPRNLLRRIDSMDAADGILVL